jgi:threonine synthase
MNAIGLRCINCGKSFPLGIYYRCDRCDFPLEVAYGPLKLDDPFEQIELQGIWRYQPVLPYVKPENRVTLGEGLTPLIEAKRLGSELGLSSLYIKNEGQNPTGSFKDRPIAFSISMAKEFGVNTVVLSSTGNAGASLSAYAARAGLRAIIFIPSETAPAKITQMTLHGAQIIPVEGTLSDAFWLAYHSASKWGWMNLTSTFLCPYGVEGDKTVAYELFQQLGKTPDWVIVPVSVGPLAVGIYKGFADLKARGLVTKLPRIVAAQAAGCAPIARAFERGRSEVTPWDEPIHTVAGGIADSLNGYEKDGTYLLRMIQPSGGIATASNDDEILQAARLTASMEGVFCEPTGAVSIAAIHQLKKAPAFSAEDSVVCLMTGHGLKQIRTYEGDVHLSIPIKPTLSSVETFLKEQNPLSHNELRKLGNHSKNIDLAGKEDL